MKYVGKLTYPLASPPGQTFKEEKNVFQKNLIQIFSNLLKKFTTTRVLSIGFGDNMNFPVLPPSGQTFSFRVTVSLNP